PAGAAQGGTDEYSLGDRTDEVRKQLLARVRRLAKSNKDFWLQANPAAILWFWWGCDLENEVRKFTDTAMHTKVGLLGLLQAAIGRVRSSSGDYERVPKSWNHVVDIELLAKQAASLLTDSQSTDEERVLTKRFLKALELGAEDSF
ncbi:MAG: hypothetical protein ACRD3W_31490, partial [Terriglobales bacterium]